MKYLQANLVIAAANSRIVIPADMRSELGLPKGGKVIARLIDGAVVLEPVDAAHRRSSSGNDR